MTPRANLLLLPLLLSAGARTVSAQSGPILAGGALLVGEGTPRDANNAPFTQLSLTTIFPDVNFCHIVCVTHTIGPLVGNLVGFTYVPGSNQCFCWGRTTLGVDIDNVDDTATGSFTYCYDCRSEQPSSQPSSAPSGQPSGVPSESPSGQPSSAPSGQPSGSPSENPSGQPSGAPSENPSGQPSSAPSGQPSGSPSENPSGQPSSAPSGQPSGSPSESPSGQPSSNPSGQPSGSPSESPSGQPSSNPSELPSGVPSENPSGQPSSSPSEAPSGVPSENPSQPPSSSPSESPSGVPSENPSLYPSSAPSESPSGQPSMHPSEYPSSAPSEQPSGQPSMHPSEYPSSAPSFAPSSNPSQGCENVRTDCGWGIFNPWTCQCDCPVGICRDDNEQCYLPCTDTVHTNPWAGCVPGWDCPWFPDKSEGLCKSEMHQVNTFEIYRTAGECCNAHYGGSAACVTASKAATAPLWPIHFPGSANFKGFAPAEAENIWGVEAGQASRWFPDLHNKRNCVFGSNYESWMNEDGFAAEYLSSNSEDCCEKWYPSLGSSCPDSSTTAVNPEAEDEAWLGQGGTAQNYYFPDFKVNNCGFGRDYPAWMGINGFEKHYLFRTGAECCTRYFSGVGGCPFENTPQTGTYWEAYQDKNDNPIVYNHTYYPDIHAGTCVNGTDFPSWMAEDEEFKRYYLFKNLEGCCNYWIKNDVSSCVSNVIQGVYLIEPCPLNRPEADCNFTPTIANMTEHRLTMWYPDIDGYRCKNDGAVPTWMLQEGYYELYLFNTQAQCCAAFGYC